MADDPLVPLRSREGVWSKIIRAEEHLAVIKAEVDLYLEGDPYKLVGQFDSDTGEYRARVFLREAPSIRLQLLIGDFAHNLRSALDHLADWLVVRNGLAPTRRTGFPICTRRTDDQGKPITAKIEPAVSVEAMAVVEALQPYHRGDRALDDKLAVLAVINNTDKHRGLWVATSVMSRALVWVEFAGIRLTEQRFVQGRFKHGAELAVFPPIVPPHLHEAVEVKAQATALVTFSEPEPIGDKPVVDLLGQLLDYVREAVVRPVMNAELTRRVF